MRLPFTVSELEKFLSNIGSLDNISQQDIYSELKSSCIPLEDIARAQVLNTWLAIRPVEPNMNVDNENPATDDALRLVSSTALGLVTLTQARKWFHKDQKKLLLNVRKLYFQQMQNWPDLAATNQTLMLCDDSYSQGLPSPLFDQAGVLRSDTYFDVLVNKLLASVMRSEELKGAFLQQSSLLTTLIYELVKNTQDHALFDAYGAGIDDSIRILLVRYYDLDDIKIDLTASLDAPLEPHLAYLNALKDRPSAGLLGVTRKRFRGVLEFSVLDSGPGFVGRKLQREVRLDEDIDTEYNAVLSCLRAGHSTARNPNRGLGLNDVLRALRSLSGFIRVRTNRISAYREFRIYKDSVENEMAPVLHDWRKGYSKKASAFARVRGATVSVLVPVEA